MDAETCFICGVKLGRGNRSELATQEKMDKLVSVSNTVEHSSTIISDILSRILNETVMREESVCRICFNLLNDIDYHLKEAQEKTDEVTAKFLDRDKDPLSYKPQPIMTHMKTSPDHRKHKKSGRSVRREEAMLEDEDDAVPIRRRGGKQVVTTSGGRPGKTAPNSRVIQTFSAKSDISPKSQSAKTTSRSPPRKHWPQTEPISPEPPPPAPPARPVTTVRSLPPCAKQTLAVKTPPKVTEHRSRSPSHVPVKGGGKGPRFFKGSHHHSSTEGPDKIASLPEKKGSPVSPSPRPSSGQIKKVSVVEFSPEKKSPGKTGLVRPATKSRMRCLIEEAEVSAGSADEMSVNMIAEKKRKLLSRVLGPSKKSRVEEEDEQEEGGEEDNRLVVDTGREKEKRRKEKKRRKKEKKLRAELEKRMLEKETEDLNDDDLDDDCEGYGEDEGRDRRDVKSELVLKLSDEESEEERPSPKQNRKSTDIRTVDLAQLDDLFSVPQGAAPKHPSNGQLAPVAPPPSDSALYRTPPSAEKVYAKKSVPRDQGSKKELQALKNEVYVVSDSSQMAISTGEGGSSSIMTSSSDVITSPGVTREVVATYTVPVQQFDHNQVVTLLPETSSQSKYVATHVVTKREPKNEQGAYADAKMFSIGATPTNSTKGDSPTKPPGVASIPCPQCNKMFMRPYNMRVHIDRVHNKVKPFQCEFCDKSFSTTSDLKQHLSAHGMGKIHKCEDCGREFTNRDSAILHRKQHNNERTHFCGTCAKGFFKASCLQRHMRSHTGEKPYSCEQCGRGFTQATTVKNHKKVCKAAERAIEMAPVTLDFENDNKETDVNVGNQHKVAYTRSANVSI